MLLITMHEWLGPSREMMCRADALSHSKEVKERAASFVTSLSLGEALLRIKGYERAYNERYRSVKAVNFTLQGVTEIPPLTDEQIEAANLEVVERTPQKSEDWE